jgi:hypothetical protein
MNRIAKRILFWGLTASVVGLTLVFSASKASVSQANDTIAIARNSHSLTELKSNHNDLINANHNSEIPRFTGEIGHYQASQSFTDFIFENQGELVFIDAYYVPASWDELEITNNQFGVDYFHLWHDCFELLEPNAKPSYHQCTGTSFSIDRGSSPKDADFTYIRDILRIRGYFAIRGCGGPHQGSMGCTLRPLNPEDVR